MVKFYCCEDFKADSLEEGTYYLDKDIEEKPRILRIKYCRYCGQRLSFNIPTIRSKQAD